MKTLKMLLALVVLAAWGAMGVQAADPPQVVMASLAPADAKALIEVDNAAGLRQLLLDSKVWAAFEATQAYQEWRASDKYAEMQKRIEELCANLGMDRETALSAYLGGRTAVVLLPSAEPKKPSGVLLLETTEALAKTFIKAVGAQEAKRYSDSVTIWQVVKDTRTDRMAWAGGVLVMSSATDNALERVLDVIVGGAAALSKQQAFADAAGGLPDNWRIRAYAAQVPPRKAPGAVAMYMPSKARLHFEWRMVGPEQGDLAINQPVVLTGPAALPARSVAAIATVFHPQAIWDKVTAKAAEAPDGTAKMSRAEMFIRGWFPGQTMQAILGAFGPEAAAALLKGDGGAPGAVALVRLTESGKAVAKALKDGLAAKAMLLAAFTQKPEGQQQDAPRLSVREEMCNNTSMLIIEAPGVLEKILGDWAKDVALCVAVTDNWLIVGTSVSGTKATIATATGESQDTLAAAMGADVPAEAATRWGVIRPAEGADVVLGFAERLAGAARVEEAKKLTNLAELLKLIDRVSWQRIDEGQVIRGQADLQAITE